MKKLTLTIFSLLLISQSYAQEIDIKAQPSKIEKTTTQITEVVSSPLKDFNMTKDKIPLLLEEAKNNPYFIKENSTCESIKEEIEALNLVLPLDIDEKIEKDNTGEVVTKAAFKALNNTVQGAIPYRGWIRKISGAEKNEKNVNKAIKAGLMRRAFLKGYLTAKSCSNPSNNIENSNLTNDIIDDISPNHFNNQ